MEDTKLVRFPTTYDDAQPLGETVKRVIADALPEYVHLYDQETGADLGYHLWQFSDFTYDRGTMTVVATMQFYKETL